MGETNQIIAGKYRLLDRLGEGAFASTWLARDESLGAQVALKIMRLSGEREQTALLFRQEARALARINNPHVGGVLDFGELEDGRPYLALEYVQGENIGRLLDFRGPLPVESALVIAECVADALSAAHAVGVIHRDLKPSNIIVPMADGEPHFGGTKLIDFGVQGQLRASTGTTQAGQLYGTPQYMAPEQFRADEQSPATDVYGFAAALFEMLYGRPPFIAESFIEIASKTLNEDLVFPDTPSIPEEVRGLIRRSMSKEAKARPQNGSELLAQIRMLRLRLDTPERAWAPAALSPQNQRPAATAVPSFGGVPVPERAAAGARSKWMLIALGAGMTLFLAVAIFFSPDRLGGQGGTESPGPGRLVGVLTGLILASAGVGMWFLLRKWLGARKTAIKRDADNILLGRRSLDALTQSLAIEVDAIITRVKQVDEIIIAHTLAMMVKEYENAKDSKDRQSALVNAVAFLEKLTTKLSPWYVRHDKLVAFVVSSVGVLGGLVTIVMNVIKIKKGAP
jgi:serine/threonine-protein kinase